MHTDELEGLYVPRSVQLVQVCSWCLFAPQKNNAKQASKAGGATKRRRDKVEEVRRWRGFRGGGG